jgi:hypothetical protein
MYKNENKEVMMSWNENIECNKQYRGKKSNIQERNVKVILLVNCVMSCIEKGHAYDAP